MTQSPTPIQSAEFSNQVLTRQSHLAHGHSSHPQFNRKPATSVSLPAVPTLQSLESDVNRPNQDGNPLLVRAAGDGLGEMVEKLLTSGANIDAVNATTKRNALIEASMQGHARIVEFLLDYRCSTQHLDSDHMSALHHSAQKGYQLVAKALLDRGAAVDIQGLNGLTPLYLASWAPHASMVMLLLQRHANVNGRDAYQRSALHVAASRGFTNICTLLFDHGAQLESRDGNSKTPLQLAVSAEHIDVVQNFLARSDPRPTDLNFTSAFFSAIEVGNVQLAEAFFDRGATLKGMKSESYKPITLAAKSGNLGMVDLITRRQGKVKEKDSNGWTALHYAAHYGHTPIVERLADKEISTSKTTSKKETPLHLAVKAQQFGVAELLLRTKASETITSKNIHGQHALHHASRGGDRNIVNLLFSHKAKLDVDDFFGWKPLHVAVAYGHLPIVEHLLGHGASTEERLGTTDCNKKDTHSYVEAGYWAEARWPFPGSKPLHLAVEFGHAEIARFLVGRGAKVDSACGEGWRPLHLAAFTASPMLVETLLSVGAYPHAVTDLAKQRTALDIACWRSQSQFLPNAAKSVSENDLLRCQELLHHAMTSVAKRGQEQYFKSMKIITGKGPEEKSEYLRAANVAMEVVARGSGLDVKTQMSRYA